MRWRCDTCRGQIDDPRDGWVEWLRTSAGTYRASSLRLVHSAPASFPRGRCQYDEGAQFEETGLFVADQSLSSLIARGGEAECRRLVAARRWGQTDGARMADRVARGDT